MIGQFLVVEGPDKGKSYPVEAGKPILIGRGQNSDTKLTDPSVSRVHCQVEVVGEQLLLSDNGSVSGTIVNGKKVDQHPRRNRGTIQIGGTILRFEVKGVHEQSTLVGGGPTPKMAPETADELAELVDQTLSHYELGPIIARGQTGVVFKGVSIPDLFESSIMRMLAKDQGDRFQTPTELLRDFERVAKFNGITLNA